MYRGHDVCVSTFVRTLLASSRQYSLQQQGFKSRRKEPTPAKHGAERLSFAHTVFLQGSVGVNVQMLFLIK